MMLNDITTVICINKNEYFLFTANKDNT